MDTAMDLTNDQIDDLIHGDLPKKDGKHLRNAQSNQSPKRAVNEDVIELDDSAETKKNKKSTVTAAAEKAPVTPIVDKDPPRERRDNVLTHRGVFRASQWDAIQDSIRQWKLQRFFLAAVGKCDEERYKKIKKDLSTKQNLLGKVTLHKALVDDMFCFITLNIDRQALKGHESNGLQDLVRVIQQLYTGNDGVIQLMSPEEVLNPPTILLPTQQQDAADIRSLHGCISIRQISNQHIAAIFSTTHSAGQAILQLEDRNLRPQPMLKSIGSSPKLLTVFCTIRKVARASDSLQTTITNYLKEMATATKQTKQPLHLGKYGSNPDNRTSDIFFMGQCTHLPRYLHGNGKQKQNDHKKWYTLILWKRRNEDNSFTNWLEKEFNKPSNKDGICLKKWNLILRKYEETKEDYQTNKEPIDWNALNHGDNRDSE